MCFAACMGPTKSMSQCSHPHCLSEETMWAATCVLCTDLELDQWLRPECRNQGPPSLLGEEIPHGWTWRNPPQFQPEAAQLAFLTFKTGQIPKGKGKVAE